jgi:hypothetical protein
MASALGLLGPLRSKKEKGAGSPASIHAAKRPTALPKAKAKPKDEAIDLIAVVLGLIFFLRF